MARSGHEFCLCRQFTYWTIFPPTAEHHIRATGTPSQQPAQEGQKAEEGQPFEDMVLEPYHDRLLGSFQLCTCGCRRPGFPVMADHKNIFMLLLEGVFMFKEGISGALALECEGSGLV